MTKARTRRAGRSERVAVIVEGACEREAFRRLPSRLPGIPPLDLAAATRSNLRGVGGTAPVAAIARKVVPRAILLAPDNARILVCLDREDRVETPGAFARAVARAISAELAAREKVLGIPLDVVVVDRAFEAWLLADIASLCIAKRRPVPRRRCYEGYLRGRDVGSRVLARTLGSYGKTSDGPDLFARLDFAQARRDCTSGRGWGSKSLDYFLGLLGV